MKYKVKRLFSTADSFGKVMGRPGSVLEVGVDMQADTAERLAARGLIEPQKRKPRKKAAEE